MDLWSIGGGSTSASRSVKFGVVVFKASLLKGSIHHRSMLLHYTSPLPIDHRSMLHHYTPYICPRYLGMMLYVKLMWCSGSMVNWRRGLGQSVMKLIWCNGFPDIYAQLGGVNLLWVYVHCAIYETHFV